MAEPVEVDTEPEAEPVIAEPAVAEQEAPEPVASGENPFPPGVEVHHEFFGTGVVRESRPKDEHWRLEVEFSDGAQRTLLSSFVTQVGETDVADAVEAEPEPEPVDAEAVEVPPVEPELVETEPEPEPEVEPEAAEPAEPEPAEPEPAEPEPAEAEAVTAEPEPLPEAPASVEPVIIEAEMIDEPLVATPVIEPQEVLEVEPEVPLLTEPVVVDLGDPDLESDPEVSAMGSLETKRTSGRGRRKGQKARCSKCGGEGHYAKTCRQ